VNKLSRFLVVRLFAPKVQSY